MVFVFVNVISSNLKSLGEPPSYDTSIVIFQNILMYNSDLFEYVCNLNKGCRRTATLDYILVHFVSNINSIRNIKKKRLSTK